MSKQPTEEELDTIRDEIAWGNIAGDTYILPAIAEYVLRLWADRDAALAELNETELELEAAHAENERLTAALQSGAIKYLQLVAQRDAALRERDDLGRSLDTSAASLEAAIAENERLKGGGS